MVARMTRSQKQLFERAAALEGRSIASFVLNHALKAAEEVLHRDQVIRLDAEESRRFVKALLGHPSAPAPRLARAVEEHRQLVTER